MLTISVWSFGGGKTQHNNLPPNSAEEQSSSLLRLPSHADSAALAEGHRESKGHHDFSSLLFQHYVLPALSFSLGFKGGFLLLHLSL